MLNEGYEECNQPEVFHPKHTTTIMNAIIPSRAIAAYYKGQNKNNLEKNLAHAHPLTKKKVS
jgi:hypothetical protein